MDKSGAVTLACLGIAITLGVGLAHFQWDYTTGVDFTYNKVVRSHVLNAYEMYSPEGILEEMNQTEAGMHRLGLTEDMYGAYWDWQKTPDVQMKFQYQFIKDYKTRINETIAWRDQYYSNPNTSISLRDVYNEKISNLRNFMREGCGGDAGPPPCMDWIAHNAYLANFYPYYFVWGWLHWLMSIVGIVFFVAMFWIRVTDY